MRFSRELFFYPSKNYLFICSRLFENLKGRIEFSRVSSHGLKWGNKPPTRKRCYFIASHTVHEIEMIHCFVPRYLLHCFFFRGEISCWPLPVVWIFVIAFKVRDSGLNYANEHLSSERGRQVHRPNRVKSPMTGNQECSFSGSEMNSCKKKSVEISRKSVPSVIIVIDRFHYHAVKK